MALFNGSLGHCLREQSSRDVKLTTHLHLVPKLKMPYPIAHTPSWRSKRQLCPQETNIVLCFTAICASLVCLNLSRPAWEIPYWLQWYCTNNCDSSIQVISCSLLSFFTGENVKFVATQMAKSLKIWRLLEPCFRVPRSKWGKKNYWIAVWRLVNAYLIIVN